MSGPPAIFQFRRRRLDWKLADAVRLRRQTQQAKGRENHRIVKRAKRIMRVRADWASLVCCCLFLSTFGALTCGTAGAAVLVIANRSPDPIGFTITDAAARVLTFRAASGQVIPVPTDFDVELVLDSAGDKKQYTVSPYSVYFVHGDKDGGYELQQIGLPSVPQIQTLRRARLDAAHSAGASGSADDEVNQQQRPQNWAIIPVKVMADEEIRGSYRDWAERLKKRVAEASSILEAHCRVRLQIVEVGAWRSDNSQNNFVTTMREFERQVSLVRGQVAIGFTGQYRRPVGRTKLGGIRGPLHPHILVREWPQHVSERERLEVLVHELGHYLGAVHSPETDSVMRPLLADQQAMYRRFQIKFDPVNTLVLNLVSEGLQSGRIHSLGELDLRTKVVLRGVYTDMGRVMSDDPTPPKYVALLGLPKTRTRRDLPPSRRSGDPQRLLLPGQTRPRTGSQ